jgi:hypothetical protein
VQPRPSKTQTGEHIALPIVMPCLNGRATAGTFVKKAFDTLGRSLDDETLALWARRLFWFFGVALALVEAVASRFSMTVDGISYLDLADAYWKGDWNAIVNGYWSPLYPWLLGAAIHALHASMYWESSIVHAVNFLIFLGTMAAFEFFLRALCGRLLATSSQPGSLRPLPIWAMRAFGYSLFLYAGLVWISIGIVTPDQCVAAVMYLVAGLLLHMQTRSRAWTWYAILGILLGVGYLVKAVLFPLGMVSLGATLLLTPRERFANRFARTLLTALMFAVVASPLVIALSRAKGRFTFGDSGKLAYAQMVDHLTRFGQWQGEGNLGAPKHPVRMLMVDPSVYEFATPVGGTYPPWYDASYWLEGVKPRMDIRGQIRVLADSARTYWACAIGQVGFIVACVVLFSLNRKSYSFWRGFATTWPGWLAALIGLGMYSLVLVDPRYVGSFLAIVGMSFLGGIRLLRSVRTRGVVIGLALGAAAVTLFGAANYARRNLYSSMFRPHHKQWEIAQALKQQGIRPGDTVATIIDHREGDYWARLAQVKIIEEIPLEEISKLASLDAGSHAHLVQVLQKPGVKAIVTAPAPPAGTGFRWERLGSTEYYVSSLTQAGRS